MVSKRIITDSDSESSELASEIDAIARKYAGRVCIADILGALESVRCSIIISLALDMYLERGKVH